MNEARISDYSFAVLLQLTRIAFISSTDWISESSAPAWSRFNRDLDRYASVWSRAFGLGLALDSIWVWLYSVGKFVVYDRSLRPRGVWCRRRRYHSKTLGIGSAAYHPALWFWVWPRFAGWCTVCHRSNSMELLESLVPAVVLL